MSQSDPVARVTTSARGSPLWLVQASCWLALLLIVAKAATPLDSWQHDPAARLRTLLLSSWMDVLFAIGCGALGAVAVLLLGRWRRTAAVVRAVVLTFFAACAIYGVAAIGLFRYFSRPLTADLIGMIGNAATIRSSVLDRITVSIGIALLAAPVLVLVAAWVVRASRRRVAVALAILSVWCAVGWSFHRKWPEDKQLTHLWLSPHLELVRSSAVRLAGGRRPGFPKDFPPEYLDEFRTFAARAPASHSHFQLPEGVARPKNVIVVVLESVGTQYLGLYGHPRDLTPTLTAEARHALVFENIYAHASFSSASFRPINYSVYPGLPWHYALLEDARPIPKTLAASMQARGARTGYFMAGDLDWGDQRWLLERQPWFETVQGAADLGCERLSSWGAEDRCLFDRLLGWMAEKPEQPFLAVVWTDQTHDPFLLSPGASLDEMPRGNTPPAYAADLTRYLNLLQNVDAQLARLFSALRERGIADDTLVESDKGSAS